MGHNSSPQLSLNIDVAKVWVDNYSRYTVVPTVSSPINVPSFLPVSSLALSPSVPENCFKVVLPCEISLLGFHLNSSMKEKICNGHYIEIFSLLPFVKDNTFDKMKNALMID